MLFQLLVNIPFVDALEKMQGYAQFMRNWSQEKDL